MSFKVSKESFQASCDALLKFQSDKNHSIIEIDDRNQITTRAKSNWCSRIISCIKRFFSCDTLHPAEKVAARLVAIFEHNKEHITEAHFYAISRLGYLMGKSEVSARTKGRFEDISKSVYSAEKLEKTQNEIQERDQKSQQQLKLAQAKIAAINGTVNKRHAKVKELEDRAKQLEMKVKAAVETQKAAENVASKIIADAEERAIVIRNVAQNSFNKSGEVNIFADDSHLLTEKYQYTCDTVLKCKEGEKVYAHWALLIGFKYFEDFDSFKANSGKKQNEKDAKESAVTIVSQAPQVQLREVDFEEFSAEDTKRFLQFVYTRKLAKGTKFEELINLYLILNFIGSTRYLESVVYEIRNLLSVSPQLIFEVLPYLPKSHPIINEIVPYFVMHSMYSDWSNIPTEKREKMASWILEYEDNRFIKHRKDFTLLNTVVAIVYMGHLGKVKDHKKTFDLLSEDAKRDGCSAATVSLLGICHLNGIGTPKDEKQAITYLQKSKHTEQSKHLLTMFALRKEQGIKMTDEEIFKSFMDNRIYPPSEYEFSKCCYYGRGTFQNTTAAIAGFEFASKRGHLESLTELGKLRMVTSTLAPSAVNGMPVLFLPDTKLALQYLIEAATRGEKEAQFLVGQVYEIGVEVAVDLKAAMVWYKKSAEQEYPAAIAAIARLS